MNKTPDITITSLTWIEDEGSLHSEFVGITHCITEQDNGIYELKLSGIFNEEEHGFIKGYFSSLEEAKTYAVDCVNDFLHESLQDLCTYAIRNKIHLNIALQEDHHE